MPARPRDEAETVTRGLRGADAPARRRRARFQRRRRPQQKKRKAHVGGGEMQPLARFQIERVDDADDGGRRRRPHRLLHGPQGFLAVGGLDQDQTGRIETKRVEPMAVQPAMWAVWAQPMGRHDHEQRRSAWQAILLLPPPPGRAQARPGWGRGRDAVKNRRDEAEGGGDAAFRCGDDFMQGAAGEAAVRQVGIDGRQAEGQGFALFPHPGHEPAQLGHHGSTVARHGKGGGLGRVGWLCKAH
jgi:hypothetical protein